MTPFVGMLELAGGFLIAVSGEIQTGPPGPRSPGPGPAIGDLTLDSGSLAGEPLPLVGSRGRLLIVGHGDYPVIFFGAIHSNAGWARFEFGPGDLHGADTPERT